MRTLNTCKKCGWQWFSKKTPHSCPSCYTTLWNRGRNIRKDKKEHLIREPRRGNTAIQAIALRKSSPCLTAKEIGDKLGVSRERIRQILKRDSLPTLRYVSKVYCANCGKRLLHGNKTGYCKKCLPIIHSVPLVCDNCGKLFIRSQTEVIRDAKDSRYTGRVFCSKQCQGSYAGKRYGFAVHPENAGISKQRDYSPIIATSKQLRQQGYSYSAIANSLNLNDRTLYWILASNNALVTVPRHLLRNLCHKPRKPQIAKVNIKVNWLKHLNFTDNEIINLTHCSKSTISRALR